MLKIERPKGPTSTERAYNLQSTERTNMNDFYPYNSSIDSLLEELTQKAVKADSNYPPYNISYTTPEDQDKIAFIEVAATGFRKEDISVYFDHDGMLIIEAEKEPEDDENIVYTHKGLSTKNFKKRFKLDKYMEVADVHLENGLLTISLVELKPEIEKFEIN